MADHVAVWVESRGAWLGQGPEAGVPPVKGQATAVSSSVLWLPVSLVASSSFVLFTVCRDKGCHFPRVW